MNLIEKIVERMTIDILPIIKTITSPISVKMPNGTSFYINNKGIDLTHDAYCAEHIKIELLGKDNALVQTRPNFNGTFSKEIIEDLDDFIEHHIKTLNAGKAKRIKERIMELQEEYDKLTTNR